MCLFKGPLSLGVKVLFLFWAWWEGEGHFFFLPRRIFQISIKLLEDEFHCGAGSKALT